MRTRVVLVDADVRRRARIVCESPHFVHIEPFQDSGELESFWPRNASLILAEDSAGAPEAVLAAMERAGKWLPLIAYHHAPSVARVVEVIRMGAADYLAYPFEMGALGERLAKAIGDAEPDLARRRRRAAALARISALTPREREVAEKVADGLTNKEIAALLSISPRTVEIHRSNMIQKLRARGTGDAMRILHDASQIQ